ncbi:uncharacterized protein B0I36DRAFT_358671 [Microdochium trichocladiopsis]|uniref:Uncharacterized protein n=1 Tax=Microdochium trichocladiopsis TaxID=1682393 RepID=A0A9P8YJN5_9PEZI|nr:uncharacterized protein B0I36DRAFT_358671 [Microdochium trichocladiopsis]KAH7041510.1 hypothetical protein B0I36DRAFT_358671 [Microdochium trichocladiopsis]
MTEPLLNLLVLSWLLSGGDAAPSHQADTSSAAERQGARLRSTGFLAAGTLRAPEHFRAFLAVLGAINLINDVNGPPKILSSCLTPGTTEHGTIIERRKTKNPFRKLQKLLQPVIDRLVPSRPPRFKGFKYKYFYAPEKLKIYIYYHIISFDGVIIIVDALPGSYASLAGNYNSTSIYEVGHWMGLCYVFNETLVDSITYVLEILYQDHLQCVEDDAIDPIDISLDPPPDPTT